MEQHAYVPEDMKPKDDLHQPIVSPVHHGAMARRSSTDSPQQRASGISDRSAEQSPLHRNHVKASRDRRVSSEGGQGVAPNTPGRLKTRAGGRGDDSPDKSPPVPKFGEWDESNPSAGDGYTGIFSNVVTERQTGSAKVPYLIDDSVYLNSGGGHGSNRNKPASCWCFGWGKK